MRKVLVIAGLTASGKSSLGVKLAHLLNGEIISADSVAVYRELNIGSAKPSIIERDGITHHLIDVVSITDGYDVAQFQTLAREAIDLIHAKGKLPIVVGGTGLYINALIKDYKFEDEQEKPEMTFDFSESQMYSELLKVDPVSAQEIHPNNVKRIKRALESFYFHQKTKEEINEKKKDELLYDAHVLFLQGDRKLMYERMNSRVDIMMESGLVKEVKDLLDVYPDLFSFKSMSAIGYREFEAYFDNELSLVETTELIKRNTRRFAKRQVTWFKHQMACEWVDIFNEESMFSIEKNIHDWLKE